MRIVFLETSVDDLMWFRQYYRAVFPEGQQNARQRFENMTALLVANPYMGRPVPGYENVRKVALSRTPFSLIYRVTPKQIEVLRLLDGRRRDNF